MEDEDEGRESKRYELHDESKVSFDESAIPLPLLSPLLEYVDPEAEVLDILEYSPLLLYDNLALLVSPSSLGFNRTERVPNLPSESLGLLLLLREDSAHGRS